MNALESQLQDLRLKSERLATANKLLTAELDSERQESLQTLFDNEIMK